MSMNSILTVGNPHQTAEDLFGGIKLIADLQAKARAALDPFIPENSQVALLDFPDNSNVGDSLIWLGETAYLAQRNLQPTYVCHMHNLDSERLRATLNEKSVILMHGGGNFGTLWTDEQNFRLRILREFVGVPVVQFPQSIYFEDDGVLAATREAIKRHGKYTLMVRDEASYAFATSHFDCKVVLCPDMAFFIGSLSSPAVAPFDRFILARTDHEAAHHWFVDAPHLSGGATVFHSDWLEQGTTEKLLNRMQVHSVGLRKLLDPRNTGLFKLMNRVSRARLARGKQLLEQGRVVIADRLHVHILSILLNKPHVLIDNKYRKLGTFHEAWTTGYGGVKFVNTLEEAYAAAREFDLQLRAAQG
ncbi:MAG TPA: polysaccharide pyruvyl transferase family protein [Burkholderiaceae bacterium]|jgi:pyruvyl transferase EpsO